MEIEADVPSSITVHENLQGADVVGTEIGIQITEKHGTEKDNFAAYAGEETKESRSCEKKKEPEEKASNECKSAGAHKQKEENTEESINKPSSMVGEVKEHLKQEDIDALKLKEKVQSSDLECIEHNLEATGPQKETKPQTQENEGKPNEDYYTPNKSSEDIDEYSLATEVPEKETKDKILKEVESTVTAVTEETSLQEIEGEDKMQLDTSDITFEEEGLETTELHKTRSDDVAIINDAAKVSDLVESKGIEIPTSVANEADEAGGSIENEVQNETRDATPKSENQRQVSTGDTTSDDVLEHHLEKVSAVSSKEHNLMAYEASETTEDTSEKVVYKHSPSAVEAAEEKLLQKDESINPRDDPNMGSIDAEKESENDKVCDQNQDQHRTPSLNTEKGELEEVISESINLTEVAKFSETDKLEISEDGQSLNTGVEKVSGDENPVNNASTCDETCKDPRKAIFGQGNSARNNETSSMEGVEKEKIVLELDEGGRSQGIEDAETESKFAITNENLQSAEPLENLRCASVPPAEDHSKETIPETSKLVMVEDNNSIKDQNSELIEEKPIGQDFQEGQTVMNKEIESKLEAGYEMTKMEDGKETIKNVVFAQEMASGVEQADGIESIKEQLNGKESCTAELQTISTAENIANEVKDPNQVPSENLEATYSNDNTETVESKTSESLNGELEESSITKASEEETTKGTEKPVDATSSVTEGENIEAADIYYAKIDTAKVTLATEKTSLEDIQLDDKPIRDFDTTSDDKSLVPERPTDECETADKAIVIAENSDASEVEETKISDEVSNSKKQDVKEIHETGKSLKVENIKEQLMEEKSGTTELQRISTADETVHEVIDSEQVPIKNLEGTYPDDNIETEKLLTAEDHNFGSESSSTTNARQEEIKQCIEKHVDTISSVAEEFKEKIQENTEAADNCDNEKNTATITLEREETSLEEVHIDDKLVRAPDKIPDDTSLPSSATYANPHGEVVENVKPEETIGLVSQQPTTECEIADKESMIEENPDAVQVEESKPSESKKEKDVEEIHETGKSLTMENIKERLIEEESCTIELQKISTAEETVNEVEDSNQILIENLESTYNNDNAEIKKSSTAECLNCESETSSTTKAPEDKIKQGIEKPVEVKGSAAEGLKEKTKEENDKAVNKCDDEIDTAPVTLLRGETILEEVRVDNESVKTFNTTADYVSPELRTVDANSQGEEGDSVNPKETTALVPQDAIKVQETKTSDAVSEFMDNDAERILETERTLIVENIKEESCRTELPRISTADQNLIEVKDSDQVSIENFEATYANNNKETEKSAAAEDLNSGSEVFPTTKAPQEEIKQGIEKPSDITSSVDEVSEEKMNEENTEATSESKDNHAEETNETGRSLPVENIKEKLLEEESCTTEPQRITTVDETLNEGNDSYQVSIEEFEARYASDNTEMEKSATEEDLNCESEILSTTKAMQEEIKQGIEKPLDYTNSVAEEFVEKKNEENTGAADNCEDKINTAPITMEREEKRPVEVQLDEKAATSDYMNLVMRKTDVNQQGEEVDSVKPEENAGVVSQPPITECKIASKESVTTENPDAVEVVETKTSDTVPELKEKDSEEIHETGKSLSVEKIKEESGKTEFQRRSMADETANEAKDSDQVPIENLEVPYPNDSTETQKLPTAEDLTSESEASLTKKAPEQEIKQGIQNPLDVTNSIVEESEENEKKENKEAANNCDDEIVTAPVMSLAEEKTLEEDQQMKTTHGNPHGEEVDTVKLEETSGQVFQLPTTECEIAHKERVIAENPAAVEVEIKQGIEKPDEVKGSVPEGLDEKTREENVKGAAKCDNEIDTAPGTLVRGETSLAEVPVEQEPVKNFNITSDNASQEPITVDANSQCQEGDSVKLKETTTTECEIAERERVIEQDQEAIEDQDAIEVQDTKTSDAVSESMDKDAEGIRETGGSLTMENIKEKLIEEESCRTELPTMSTADQTLNEEKDSDQVSIKNFESTYANNNKETEKSAAAEDLNGGSEVFPTTKAPEEEIKQVIEKPSDVTSSVDEEFEEKINEENTEAASESKDKHAKEIHDTGRSLPMENIKEKLLEEESCTTEPQRISTVDETLNEGNDSYQVSIEKFEARCASDNTEMEKSATEENLNCESEVFSTNKATQEEIKQGIEKPLHITSLAAEEFIEKKNDENTGAADNCEDNINIAPITMVREEKWLEEGQPIEKVVTKDDMRLAMRKTDANPQGEEVDNLEPEENAGFVSQQPTTECEIVDKESVTAENPDAVEVVETKTSETVPESKEKDSEEIHETGKSLGVEKIKEQLIKEENGITELQRISIADETVNEVTDSDQVPIENLEATHPDDNTDTKKLPTAEDLNCESEASSTKKAQEEEIKQDIQNPKDVTSSIAEESDDKVKEENKEAANKCDDEIDTAPVTSLTEETTEEEDQAMKITYANPHREEVDTVKREETSGQVSQLPTTECEIAYKECVVAENPDAGEVEIKQGIEKPVEVKGSVAEGLKEKTKEENEKASDKCDNEIDTAPVTLVRGETSLEEVRVDNESVKTFNTTSDDARPELRTVDANSQCQEGDSVKATETTALVPRLPTTECEVTDKEKVIEQDKDAIEVQETKTSDAVSESTDKDAEGIHETGRSLTVENIKEKLIEEESCRTEPPRMATADQILNEEKDSDQVSIENFESTYANNNKETEKSAAAEDLNGGSEVFPTTKAPEEEIKQVIEKPSDVTSSVDEEFEEKINEENTEAASESKDKHAEEIHDAGRSLPMENIKEKLLEEESCTTEPQRISTVDETLHEGNDSFQVSIEKFEARYVRDNTEMEKSATEENLNCQSEVFSTTKASQEEIKQGIEKPLHYTSSAAEDNIHSAPITMAGEEKCLEEVQLDEKVATSDDMRLAIRKTDANPQGEEVDNVKPEENTSLVSQLPTTESEIVDKESVIAENSDAVEVVETKTYETLPESKEKDSEEIHETGKSLGVEKNKEQLIKEESGTTELQSTPMADEAVNEVTDSDQVPIENLEATHPDDSTDTKKLPTAEYLNCETEASSTKKAPEEEIKQGIQNPEDVTNSIAEESEERVKEENKEAANKCDDEIDTAPVTSLTEETTEEEDQAMKITYANPHGEEVDTVKLEETSGQVSQLPTTECEIADKEHLIAENPDAVDVEQTKTSDALSESKEKDVEEILETGKSLTMENIKKQFIEEDSFKIEPQTISVVDETVNEVKDSDQLPIEDVRYEKVGEEVAEIYEPASQEPTHKTIETYSESLIDDEKPKHAAFGQSHSTEDTNLKDQEVSAYEPVTSFPIESLQKQMEAKENKNAVDENLHDFISVKQTTGEVSIPDGEKSIKDEVVHIKDEELAQASIKGGEMNLGEAKTHNTVSANEDGATQDPNEELNVLSDVMDSGPAISEKECTVDLTKASEITQQIQKLEEDSLAISDKESQLEASPKEGTEPKISSGNKDFPLVQEDTAKVFEAEIEDSKHGQATGAEAENKAEECAKEEAPLTISEKQTSMEPASNASTDSTGNIALPIVQQDPTEKNFKAETEYLKPGKASEAELENRAEECGEQKRTSNAGKETTEKFAPVESAEISLSNLLQKSTKTSLQVSKHEQLNEEKELTISKQELQADSAETTEVREAKTDEVKDEEEVGDEHKKTDLGSDALVMVEAQRDLDVKVAHKKSHNILSDVGSKVKHSIAKVKKVITGKSSHHKSPSPK